METVDYDEEADIQQNEVPEWVDIVVPIATCVLFVLVIVWLYRTKIEVQVETLEKFVKKIPYINRCLTTSWIEDGEAGNKPRSKTDNPDNAPHTADSEKQPFIKTNFSYQFDYEALVER